MKKTYHRTSETKRKEEKFLFPCQSKKKKKRKEKNDRITLIFGISQAKNQPS